MDSDEWRFFEQAREVRGKEEWRLKKAMNVGAQYTILAFMLFNLHFIQHRIINSVKARSWTDQINFKNPRTLALGIRMEQW